MSTPAPELPEFSQAIADAMVAASKGSPRQSRGISHLRYGGQPPSPGT